MEITAELLEEIVQEQEISGLGLVTPDGRPHCTPVWIHHHQGTLYVFTRTSRAKYRYAKKQPECMVAFDFASLRGTIRMIYRESEEYQEIYDLPDERYGHEEKLTFYKENWNVALAITPTRLYR